MWPLLAKIPALFGPVVQALTGLNFEAIGTFFKDLFASILKYWQYWLIGLLLGCGLASTYGLYDTRISLTKEKAAHAYDIKSFKDAQAAANNKAQEERAILQKESKANADQADANYSTLLARYHTSLMRYAPSKGGTKFASNNQLSSPEGSDGPSASTDLPATLTITGDDANICAINTARLQAVRDWATTLPQTEGDPK